MPPVNQASAVAVELEKVRSILPKLREVDTTFLDKLPKNGPNVEIASYRDVRIPLDMFAGGKLRQYDIDGGAMGRGTGTEYKVATLTPVDLAFAVEFTDKAKKGTDNKTKAVQNLVKRETINSMKQFKASLDKQLNAFKTGYLGVIEVIAGSVFTLEKPLGAQLFYDNQTIEVQPANLAGSRGTAVITLLETDDRKITVDAVPGGTIVGDVLMIEGASGATPTTLRPIKYHQDSAATGTWQGLNRASFPRIRTPEVNAANAALTTGPLRLALDKVLMRLGVETESNLVMYTHPAQIHAYEQLGVQVTHIEKSGGNQTLDRAFGGKKTFSGVPFVKAINADPSRIDFLSMEHFGRAVVSEIDFRTNSDGSMYYVLYSAAPGGVLAAELYYYTTSFQVFNDNPGAGSFVSTLAIPSGYPGA